MACTLEDLTNTLKLALSQSQGLADTINDQKSRIDELEGENGRLQKELEAARKSQHECPSVDGLFQLNVEAKAEISRLKHRLKRYKDKASVSSPSSTRHVPTSSSPKPVSLLHLVQDVTAESYTPPAKRRRTSPILEEAPTTISYSHVAPSVVSRKSAIERQAAAIPFLTEDGEEHTGITDIGELQGKRSLQRQGSLYQRLDNLLTTPSHNRGPPSRPTASTDVATTPTALQTASKRMWRISNIDHENETPVANSVREPQTNTRQKLPPRKPKSASTAAAPLRKRPLEQLSISDFKPNPRWLDSEGMSYDQFLYGQNKTRIEDLVKTLPTMPGDRERGRALTDDELLLEFMGPGMEGKINKLTPAARKHLIHEAKLKCVVRTFGKQRADYDRENAPPGFWNTDMPGTQEEIENRRLAAEKQRAEVKRRYDDAISRHGRWVFADEVVTSSEGG